MTIEVTLQDGRIVRQDWDGTGHHHRFELQTDVPAVSAAIAPDLQVAIDEDLTNDALTASGRGGPTAHLWSRLFYVAQTLLQLAGP